MPFTQNLLYCLIGTHPLAVFLRCFFLRAEYGNKLGINFTNKPLIIETIPQRNGCFVVITLISEKMQTENYIKSRKMKKHICLSLSQPESY